MDIKSILAKHSDWLKGLPGGEKADLSRADLLGANLYRANLYGANLYRANLYGANNINIPLSCPEKGSFIGFKKNRERFYR